MNWGRCPIENEVVRALKDGHWPDGCAQELRSHVTSCSVCGDLVLITESFQRARCETAHQVPAISSELIWWRAQLRRRNAATNQVSRPIKIAEIFAFVILLLVAVVFAGSQYNHGLHWSSWAMWAAPARILHPLWMDSSTFSFLLLLPALGIVVLASGIVLYFASESG